MNDNTTTASKQESIDVFNAKLIERGEQPMTETDLIDWNLQGGETISDLREWAGDLASDLHTERCEAKDAWRYEV